MDKHGPQHLFYGEGGGMHRPHLIPAEKLREFGKRILDKVKTGFHDYSDGTIK